MKIHLSTTTLEAFSGKRKTNRLHEAYFIKMPFVLSITIGSWVIAMLAGTAFGQTSSEVEEKYGASIKTYLVSEHIWMTPIYTNDGQVCQMILFPRRLGPHSIYLGNTLPIWELKTVLEQIVPSSERGKMVVPSGSTLAGGRSLTTIYKYEKVTIDFRSSGCYEVIKPEEEKKSQPKQLMPGEKDDTIEIELQLDKMRGPNVLSNQFARRAEAVVIYWHNRKCAAN